MVLPFVARFVDGIEYKGETLPRYGEKANEEIVKLLRRNGVGPH
jgi:hypothetical protein